jgi:hypothetical protein
MGTHIIWRNPSPPRKVEFQLRRVASNQITAVYRVASPNYKHPFELIRKNALWTARVTGQAPQGAELVLARW